MARIRKKAGMWNDLAEAEAYVVFLDNEDMLLDRVRHNDYDEYDEQYNYWSFIIETYYYYINQDFYMTLTYDDNYMCWDCDLLYKSPDGVRQVANSYSLETKIEAFNEAFDRLRCYAGR